MNEPKFTKGPWYIKAGKTHCCIRVDERVISDMRTVSGIYNIHNAHLISVAPEMYAMLNEIVNDAKGYESRGGKLPSWAINAEKLLAKARGEK